MIKKNEKHLQSRSLADFQTSKGFTLAEVLITLGIIGVVAAMTIPTLMVDINTKQWSTAKDVFNKKLNEAMKNMNTAQVISGHTTTLSFVQELGKHFKINKICKNDDLQSCFSDTVWWGGGTATPKEVDMTTIKQSSHFGLEDWGTELIGVQFANGVTGLVAYNPECSGDPLSNQFEGSKCISILYDVSGSKNPNTSGKDLGNYGVISRLGKAACAFELDGTCYSAPSPAIPHVWNACDEDGNTTDPDDLAFMRKYGISKCMSSDHGTSDYWAGAAELCGGTSKMASNTDLAKIANYVYDTDSVAATGSIFSLNFNPTKAAELGLPSPSFWLWSGREYSEDYAYPRGFRSNGTLYTNGNGARYDSSLLAICVE